MHGGLASAVEVVGAGRAGGDYFSCTPLNGNEQVHVTVRDETPPAQLKKNCQCFVGIDRREDRLAAV